jgi:CheY-like chemotaxis protein
MTPRSVSILLVEDDPFNCFAFETLFETSGHALVGRAETGPEAVSLASLHRPSHVLMDVRLRGPMDGIQAAAELLRHLPCRIIFITGDTRRSTAVRMEDIDFSRVLIKPFSPDAMLALIGPPDRIGRPADLRELAAAE